MKNSIPLGLICAPVALLASATVGFAAAATNPGGVGLAAARDQLKNLKTPDGLEVSLFAAEPMVVNPADMDIDARGRVWITEGANYRISPRMKQKWGLQRQGGDRIVILEDKNGDGAADEAKTFYQDPSVNTALGVCVLGNKVIISSSPYVFVLTDTDGDDKADKREILFEDGSSADHDHDMHAFVFGPDGKLYFNFGNDSPALRRPVGLESVPLNGPIPPHQSTPVIDLAGNEVNNKGKPYRQGMVFRCNLDGSDVETLGHNFRNNYEVCVDSFGTMWQSDNDDDGNRGVRLNYVMDFGNFGYVDEMTGAGWGQAWKKAQDKGVKEEERPLYHFHQHDPGVVPNLIQTGNGSPTGICLYEGQSLPEVFRGQILHCDAGLRTVRGYPVENSGAGYKARAVDLLVASDSEKWYRPSDVCVAPDGSVLIADWNDAGVGGHYMADQKLETMTGRVYRVAPKGQKYSTPQFDFASADGCVAALQSPNQEARYLTWTKLHGMGAAAEPALQNLWNGGDARMKARALNLLARIPGKQRQYIEAALRDANSDLRITALRLARQTKWANVAAATDTKQAAKDAGKKALFNALGGALQGNKVTAGNVAADALGGMAGFDTMTVIRALINDPSAQVRRECAIALRHSNHPDAAKLWAQLAQQHTAGDRWSVEALGIGADKQWDAFLDAYLAANGNNTSSPAAREILWRSRARKTPALLAKVIQDKNVSSADRSRYMRSLDFITGPEKDAALLELLTNPVK